MQEAGLINSTERMEVWPKADKLNRKIEAVMMNLKFGNKVFMIFNISIVF